jgi:hypothetical protein
VGIGIMLWALMEVCYVASRLKTSQWSNYTQWHKTCETVRWNTDAVRSHCSALWSIRAEKRYKEMIRRLRDVSKFTFAEGEQVPD